LEVRTRWKAARSAALHSASIDPKRQNISQQFGVRRCAPLSSANEKSNRLNPFHHELKNP
jgi:hypothetical protein